MTLITPARASELLPNFSSADLATLTDIVNASSNVIERYCNRTFAVTSYDEVYDGTGHLNMLLNNYPLVSIDRVMYNPVSVLGISNQLQTVARANFHLDATNLTLTSSNIGVTTVRTIARSSCPTLADLAAAVNGYSADGWQATALGVYGTWATADLYSPQLAGCRWTGYSYLWHHTFELPQLQQNQTAGEIVSSFGFTRGYQNFRAIYTAGYSVIPYEIQQACAELAASVYLNRETNPNLQSETLGGYSYAAIAERSFSNLSIASKTAIEQYRNRRIAKYKVF